MVRGKQNLSITKSKEASKFLDLNQYQVTFHRDDGSVITQVMSSIEVFGMLNQVLQGTGKSKAESEIKEVVQQP